jgi:hypothetical protein
MQMAKLSQQEMFQARWASPHITANETFPDVEKTIRFFGLQRSGNHGVISWILQNSPFDRTLFLNNCNANKCPYAYFSTLEVEGKRLSWIQAKDGEAPELIERAKQAQMQVVSYETGFTDLVKGKPTDLYDGTQLMDTHDIIVKRSFLNWLSSLWKMNAKKYPEVESRIENIEKNISAWVALNSPSADIPTHVTTIHFEKWNSAAEYRSELAKQLGLSNKNLDLPRIASYGGGSSFDGNSPKLDPNAMDLNARWKTLVDDHYFKGIIQTILDDDETLEVLNFTEMGVVEIMRREFGA